MRPDALLAQARKAVAVAKAPSRGGWRVILVAEGETEEQAIARSNAENGTWNVEFQSTTFIRLWGDEPEGGRMASALDPEARAERIATIEPLAPMALAEDRPPVPPRRATIPDEWLPQAPPEDPQWHDRPLDYAPFGEGEAADVG